MSETVLAYELALRALDQRDLDSTRLFIDIARTLRDIEPLKRARRRSKFRFKLPSLRKKQLQPRY